MRTPCVGWLLAAGLLVPLLAGAARAAEEQPAPADPQALDRHVYEVVRDVINQGAELYNGGNPTACCYLYHGALMTLPPLLEHRPGLQYAVRDGLTVARGKSGVSERAFALRAALDVVFYAVRDGQKPVVKGRPGPAPPAPGGPPAAPPPPPSPPRPATAWERMGGPQGVEKIADTFLDLALADPRVNFTRNGQYKIDAERRNYLKQRLVELAGSVAGGPQQYNGKSMLAAHKGMNITDAEFTACLEDLKEALKQNHVEPGDMTVILLAVDATRKRVVQDKVKPPPRTLWERLGGQEGVEKIAGDFLDLALQDKRVNFTRGGQYKIDDARRADLKQKLVELASMASEGPLRYSGKSMLEAHKGMHITSAEYDACMEAMREALRKNGVKPEDAAQILTAVETIRKVVGK